MNNSEIKSRNLYKLATSKALKGDITGRDMASIARYQMAQSSWDNSFNDQSLDSKAIKVSILIQTKFN